MFSVGFLRVDLTLSSAGLVKKSFDSGDSARNGVFKGANVFVAS